MLSHPVGMSYSPWDPLLAMPNSPWLMSSQPHEHFAAIYAAEKYAGMEMGRTFERTANASEA
jgi:hypothetical protein